jgi:hypothetical protein
MDGNSNNFFPNQEQIKEKITRTLTDYIKELTKLLARHQLLKSNLTELQNKQGEARENERKIERSAQQQNDIEAELTKVNRQLQENIELSLMERDKLELEKNQLLQEQAKIKIDYDKLIKQYEIEIEQLKDEKRILDLRMEEQSRDLDRFYEQVRNLTQTNEKHLEEIEKLNDNIIKMTQSKNINEEIQLQLEGMISELQEKNKELDEKNRTISEITIQLNKLNSDNGQLNSNFKDFELFIDQELDRFRYNADELFYQFYDEEEQQSMRKLANELANEKRIKTANEATKGKNFGNVSTLQKFGDSKPLFNPPSAKIFKEAREQAQRQARAQAQTQEREREREEAVREEASENSIASETQEDDAATKIQKNIRGKLVRRQARAQAQAQAQAQTQEREREEAERQAQERERERERERAEREEAQNQEANQFIEKTKDEALVLSTKPQENQLVATSGRSAAQKGELKYSGEYLGLQQKLKKAVLEQAQAEAQAQESAKRRREQIEAEAEALLANQLILQPQAARRSSAPRSSVGPGLGQEEEEAVKQAARRSSASRSALENIALQNSTDKSEQGFGSALQVATRESPQAPRSVLQHLATQAARRSPQAARSSGAAEQASLSDETQSATSDTDVVAQEAAIAAKKIQRKVRKAFKKTQLPAQEEQTEKVVSDTSSISESEPALAQAEAEAQAQAQAQAARSSPPQQLKNEDSDITESEISPKSLTLTDDQQLLYNDLQKKINLTKKKFKNDTIIDQIIDLFDKLNDGNKLDSLNDIRKKAIKKCRRGDEYCLIRDAAKKLLENF